MRAPLPGRSFWASSGAGPGFRRPRPGRRLSSAGPPGGGTAPGARTAGPPPGVCLLLLPALEPGAGRDVLEPWSCRPLRSSQALQTLTHSCPEGRRPPGGARLSRPASAPSPEGGVPGRLAGGVGRNEDRGPGPLPSSPPPTPGPGRAGSPCAVRAAAPREGSSGSRVEFAAQILSPVPRLGGRSPEHLGPGRGPWAEGPPLPPRTPPPRGLCARRSRARPGVSQKSPCLITPFPS